MDFDQDKWNAIVSQWEADDEAEAAEQLESDKDAFDLAQDSTWAEKDAADAFARAPAQGPMPDAPEVDAPTRLSELPAAPADAPKPAARPPPSSLDWKGLQRRLTMGRISDDLTNNFNNSIAGVANQHLTAPPPTRSGEAEARAPLELAQAKQAMDSKDLTNETQRAALGVKAADADPNSLASQKARNSIIAAFPGMKLPDGFDNWSASDVKRFMDTGQLARLEQVRAASVDRAAKATAAAAKAEQGARDLENARKNWTKELKEIGVDPGTATQKDIDRAIELKKYAGSHELAQSNYAIAAAGRRDKDEDRKALGGGIPFAGGELKYTGQGTPREDDRREAQKVASGYGAAIAGMDDLAGRLDDFAKNPSPETKAAMNSAAQITAGHLNSAYGQGAMSQDEAKNMAATLGANFDPVSGFQFVAEKIVGDDPAAAHTLLRRLKAARQNAKASALAKARAYRYDLSSTGRTVKMKFKNGNVRDIPEGEVEEAKSRGWAEVGGG